MFTSANHYENFPVASVLLPARLRFPVQAIYRFARSADDIADEGDADAPTRLAQLAQYRDELANLSQAIGSSGIFGDLARAVAQHKLPLQLFYDLLDAFAQDVRQKRYASFLDVMDYCRRSANPIGRLLLHLFGRTQPHLLECSDRICSSLQLINFLQDVAIDYRKDRIYLPMDEIARFGVSEHQIASASVAGGWPSLMHYQIARARAMLNGGASLGHELPGRMGLELRMIVAGGRRILDKLEAVNGDIFKHRPVLKAWDWPIMFLRAALPFRSQS
ncbi:MAG: squalene synthase HpnC [Burkholderiales bacterium]